MGLITLNEARAELGFRGAAPGVTEELKEIFEVRSIQYKDPQKQEESNKITNPKDRSGRDPESSDSTKKSDAGETK